MANNAAFEEALRLVLETSGTEGVDELRQALAEMGVASDAAVADTGKLVDKLAELNATAEKAEAFDGLLVTLADLETRFDANQKAAYQLSLQIAETAAPSKELLNAQRDLRAEGDKLKASLNSQWEAVVKADTALGGLGVNTAQLAESQQRLRDDAARTAQAFIDQAKEAAQAAAETRRRNQQIEESDDRFRGQAKASTAAAASLKAYRDRANEATKETGELGTAAATTGSILNKLKGVAATALSFVGIGKLVDGIKGIIKEGSDAEQEAAKLNSTLASTGRTAEFTAEALERMAARLQKGMFDGGQVSEAMARMLTYTNIVGEQFPAAMQLTIDQAQFLGISLEGSAEIVGKALQTPSKAMESLSKQGFTLDASQKQLIKQLEATGRVAEAQAIIMDMLAESYGGTAAAAKVGTIAGLWKAATERFKDWKQEVADQGVLTYFKAQLTEMLTVVDRLAKDGTLTRWAKQTADGIITMAEAVKGATAWVVEHSGALVTLGKAFATFAIIKAIAQVNTWRIALAASTRAQWANVAAMDAAGKGAVTLGNVLKRIPTVVPITIALLGLELVSKGLQSIGEAIGDELGKNSQAMKEAGELSRKLQETLYQEAVARKAVANGLIEFRDTAVQTAAQVAAMGEAERQSYQGRVEGLKEYLQAQLGYLLRMQAMGIATEEQLQQLEQVQQRLREANDGYRAIAEGARIAGEAMKSGIGSGAQMVLERLQGIDRDAKLAASSIRDLFGGINFSDSTSLESVAVALASVAERGAEAARNVREGLLATLQQLTGEELLRFQMAAQSAFDSLPGAALNAALVLDQTLVAAFQRLGVAADRMGVQFTAAGRDATAAFSAILENARATSSQIETAFKAALGRVSTLDEARTLGALLEAAGQRGKLGFDQAARSASALNARIREVSNALDPLNDEFSRLGIQSQASLNAARDSAKSAFEAVRAGAAQGKASVEDLRRAFKAYADSARAASAESDVWKQQQVEQQLQLVGLQLQVNQGLQDQGEKGRDALGKIESAGQGAQGALMLVKDEVYFTADGMESLGEKSDKAGEQMSKASTAASGFSLELGELSDKAREAMSSLGGADSLQKFANLWNGLAAQRRELKAYKEELEGTVKGFDGLAEKRQELSNRFDLLGSGELDGVLQLETQITAKQEERTRAQRQAVEDRLREAEAAQKLQDAEDAKRVGNGNGSGPEILRIEWTAPSASVAASASAQERETAERLASLVAPLVLERVARSRSVSVSAGSRRG
jgi:hypothetical protein